jgi:CheY-like chemotaxis protein
MELLKAKEKAEESDRLKTAFLQNMSHEIRTPMNAIMGFADLIKDSLDDKSKLIKYSEIISTRCYDLLDIINDILDIAKIESGLLSINYEECILNDLFTEISSFFREYQKRLAKENIKFILVPLNEKIIIKTDKVKLKQIFINLITNALKFTEEGTIHVGYETIDEKYLQFFVRDTGRGIPADKQKLIFERFIQLDEFSNSNISGTGLGLPIVKGLINLLGGEIGLESELNKGSTFSFTIPYILTNLSKKVKVETNVISKFNGKTVLIVEDDRFNVEYINEILSSTGLKILTARTGKQAIDMVQSQAIDLILMDIRLPDINGYEITKYILAKYPSVKIIAQTAYASSEEKNKAFLAGCLDYISKPIKSNLLLSKMNNLLSA